MRFGTKLDLIQALRLLRKIESIRDKDYRLANLKTESFEIITQ